MPRTRYRQYGEDNKLVQRHHRVLERDGDLIQKRIKALQKAGHPIPAELVEDLKWYRNSSSKRTMGLAGSTYGAASKARKLTGEELERRKAELLAREK